MGRFLDITGEHFGRLKVNHIAGRNKHNQILWHCTCECGKEAVVIGHLMRYGYTQSCGCLHREMASKINLSHGMAQKPIYRIWRSMMQRCYDKNSNAYGRYGGRGISVCESWQDFNSFYADMGDRPEGLSLERVDNDGDYSPENVVWADAKAQARNRRSTVYLEHDGQRKSMAEWAEDVGMDIKTLWMRINRGMPVDVALTKGVRGHA